MSVVFIETDEIFLSLLPFRHLSQNIVGSVELIYLFFPLKSIEKTKKILVSLYVEMYECSQRAADTLDVI